MPEPVAAVDEDLILVRQACAGNWEAFYNLVSRYERRLDRSALPLTAPP